MGFDAFGVGSANPVLAAWALGSSYYNSGYGSYSNPYYAEQAVAAPTTAYDYSQPLDTQSAPPPAEAANPAVEKFDAGRQAFASGDYAGALRLTEEALKVLPNDATLHEFKGLVLFAVEKYDLAAGPLYAVLSVGPGWDWTTMIGLYSNVDAYTAQLRKLEAFVQASPSSAAGHFVLAYHYLTQGNNDAGVAQLKEVVRWSPQDKLSAQLLSHFSPTATTPGTPAAPPVPAPSATPVKQGKLPGHWIARPSGDTTIDLTIGEDGSFAWKVAAKGKPQQLAGKWSLADDILTLAQEGRGGALVGRVSWQADGKWNFRVMGSGPEDAGLTFAR